MTRKAIALITDIDGISKMNFSGKIVLAGGAFDILHPGHIEYLQEASTLGDTLIVHIPGDRRIQEKKGPARPIMSEKDRALVVAAVGCVDCVVVYNGKQFDATLIDAVRPDVYYMCEAGNPGHVEEIKGALSGFKGEIFISKLPKIASTSDIIEKIQGLDK